MASGSAPTGRRARRRLIASTAGVIALGLATPAVGAAANHATNGGATSITATGARLNGAINVDYPDSAWSFQYGTTTAYGLTTPPRAVGAGFHLVSQPVTGLRAGTTYHFRLVVYGGYPAGSSSTSADATFRTASASPAGKPPLYGRAFLIGRRLHVSHGSVTVRVRCRGTAGGACAGSIGIFTTVRRGSHRVALTCGRRSFSVKAPVTRKVALRLSGSCRSALKKARRHRLGASLGASFTSRQRTLHFGVTLLG